VNTNGEVSVVKYSKSKVARDDLVQIFTNSTGIELFRLQDFKKRFHQVWLPWSYFVFRAFDLNPQTHLPFAFQPLSNQLKNLVKLAGHLLNKLVFQYPIILLQERIYRVE
jgi:hypothetical protein